MTIRDLLKPTNDYVFKRLFGYVGNEDITKGLLSAILTDVEISYINLDCKEILEQDLMSDKLGILDIKAILNNDIQCNIEMQIIDNRDIENRLLFYWSKLYSKTISKGMGYKDAKRTIVILFADYMLDNLKKIKKYFTKWHICEDDYKNVILTKKFEIYIIELPKFKDDLFNTDIGNWVRFLKNLEVINMNDMQKDALNKAKALLEEISQDDHERELALKREMFLMDRKSEIDTALEKGKKEGYESGKKETIKEMTRRLLKDNVDIEIIKKVTELSEEEINSLKD